MANKMLIDASHPEETRVVVLRGNRVEEFDFESASKRQLRGNIYLAKVTRVEPSLQAAFIDYGGNRHGFLAFSEIHPDYYQIPVADRQALLDEDARAHHDEDDEERGTVRRNRRHRRDQPARAERRAAPKDDSISEPVPAEEATDHPPLVADRNELAVETAEMAAERPPVSPQPDETRREPREDAHQEIHAVDTGAVEASTAEPSKPVQHAPVFVDPQGYAVIEEGQPGESDGTVASASDGDVPVTDSQPAHPNDEPRGENEAWSVEAATAEQLATPKSGEDESDGDEEDEEEEHVEQLGGDAMEEVPNRVHRVRRQYKIQEVIKRRQVLLVQVVKEERGNKGAALTTYLSLAGRYSVLMPNTARGGGISRKITDSTDRKRLKAIAQELDVPEGMGVILRTAGAARTKAEVKRDFEYLLRMWESVRELTLKSTAPTLVYEEGSLVKRSIRDLYNKDIDEIIVAGEESYKEAKDFMRMLMPSHAKNVKPYREVQPIFAKAGAEAQLDAMFSNQVTLRSGGYLVINQAEALVAIDVNSGRSTREHNIEDTALRTNLEAADEVARQLRLRDLAGLIVVDFIDMEENRNNRAVERRLKEALKDDRARIQVGRISHFGLLEMSRQRIRTGVLEGSTVVCPHCTGSGIVRSTASVALHVLRVLEEALIKSSAHNLIVRTRTEVALYILNQKRTHLRELEKRFSVQVTVGADDSLEGTVYHALERGEPAMPTPDFEPKALVRVDSIPPEEPEGEGDEELESDDPPDRPAEETKESRSERNPAATTESDAAGEASPRRRRRRRRRTRGSDREGGPFVEPNSPQPSDAGLAAVAVIGGDIPAGNIPVDAVFSDGETDEVEVESFEIQPETEGGPEGAENSEARRRRRSRRGGRNRRRDGRPEGSSAPESVAKGEWLAESNEHLVPADEPEAESVTAPSFDERSADARDEAPPAASAQSTMIVETQSPGSTPEPVSVPVTAPAPESAPSSVAASLAEPAGPKRTGWWQRAKASLGGS